MALISVHRKGQERLRSVMDVQVELFSVRPAKVCKGLEARFFLDVISTLHLYAMAILGRGARLFGISNIRTSANINMFVLRLLPATVLVDPILFIVQVVP